MGVVLYDYIFLISLDSGTDFAKCFRTAYSSHILQTDFITPQVDKLFGHTDIVFYGVNRRVGDAETALRNHTGFLGIFDTWGDVSDVRVMSVPCAFLTL